LPGLAAYHQSKEAAGAFQTEFKAKIENNLNFVPDKEIFQPLYIDK
jgi:hypothetical protein